MEFQGKFFTALHKMASESVDWQGIYEKSSSASAAVKRHLTALEDLNKLLTALTSSEDHDFTEAERYREEMQKEQRRLRRAAREYYAAQYLVSQAFDGNGTPQIFSRRELTRHIEQMHRLLSDGWESGRTGRATKAFGALQEVEEAGLLLDCMRQSYGGRNGNFLRKTEDNEVVVSVKAFTRPFEKEFGISLGPGEEWRRSL